MNKQDEKIIKNYLHENEKITESSIELFWLLSSILHSKSLLRNRKDLELFTLEVLNLKYANYVYRSRSILLGRILKDVRSLELKKAVELRNNLTSFLLTIINLEKTTLYDKERDSKDKNKSTNKTNYFSDWAAVIGKKDY